MNVNHKRTGRPALLLLLSLALLISLWWLGSWVARFDRESLQLDFSAFYTAGEALNHGLSPYCNYVARDPPIWDGEARFWHSRFLYPPQVAVLKYVVGQLVLLVSLLSFLSHRLGATAAGAGQASAG